MASGLLDETIHQAEVEFVLLRFDQFPGNGGKGGVEMRRGIAGQCGRRIGEAGGAGIVQFSPKDQERLAVDDQLGGRTLLPQVRDIRGRGGRSRSALALARNESQGAQESGKEKSSHLGLPGPVQFTPSCHAVARRGVKSVKPRLKCPLP